MHSDHVSSLRGSPGGWHGRNTSLYDPMWYIGHSLAPSLTAGQVLTSRQSLGVPNRSARGRVVRFAPVVRLLYPYSPLCSCSATTPVVFYCDQNLSRCGGCNVDLQPHPSCWRSTITYVRP